MSDRLWSLIAVAVTAAVVPAAAPPWRAVDAWGDPLPPGAVARYGSVRLRHTGMIARPAFSPDGRRLVTVGDGELRLWDVATGKLHARVRTGRGEPAMEAAVGADGEVYLLGPQGVTVATVGAARPRVLLAVSDSGFTRLTLGPSGRLLAIGGDQGGVLLLEAPSGKRVAVLQSPDVQEPVMQLTIARDGKRLATAYPSGQVRVWELETRRQLWAHAPARGGMEHGVQGLAFAPDGRALAVVNGERIDLLDVVTGKPAVDFPPLTEPVLAADFSADGKQLIVVDHQGGTHQRDARTGKLLRSLPGPGWLAGFQQACFDPARHRVALADDSRVILLDTRTGRPVHPNLGELTPIERLAWPARSRTVRLMDDRRVRLWDPAAGRVAATVSAPDACQLLDLHRDGKHFLVSNVELETQGLSLRRRGDERPVWKLDADAAPVTHAAFSPDGALVACVGPTGVELRDALTGKYRQAIPLALAEGGRVRWSESGRMLAVIDQSGGRVSVHERTTGRPRFAVDIADPLDVALTPDGGRLAVLNGHGVIRVLRPGQTRPLFELVVRVGGLTQLAFSADGKWLASPCGDEVRVWDDTGRPLVVFTGHEAEVTGVAFAPDGRTMVSASRDGTAIVWDLHWRPGGGRTVTTLPDDDALWRHLAADDAEAAYRAMQSLQTDPARAVRVLGDRLTPTPATDSPRLAALVAQLDADRAADRRAAADALAALDTQAEAALRRAAAGGSAEARKAASRLLDRLAGAVLPPDRLREVRAVEVLENVGTPAARALLHKLAVGADSRLSREAKAALERLGS